MKVAKLAGEMACIPEMIPSTAGAHAPGLPTVDDSGLDEGTDEGKRKLRDTATPSGQQRNHS